MSTLQISRMRGFGKNILQQISVSPVKIPLMLSFLNQIVNSGGNFIVGIYLARSLSLEDFGLYGIGFGICMLYIGVGNAIILTQMVVNMPDKLAADKEQYAAKMLLAAIMLGIFTLVSAAVITFGAMLFRPDWHRFIGAIATVTFTSVCLLAKEFFISYAFMQRRESLALVISFLSVAVLGGGLIVEHLAGIPLTAENALLLYAAGAATAALVGYLSSHLRIIGSTRNLKPDFLEAWQHGRWALGGIVVTWIQAQAYTYVLAFSLGPAGVGLANAARIFISPFSFLIPAINKIMIPRLAEYRQSDPQKMYRISTMITAGLFIFVILYSIILLSSVDFITRIVLGRNDPGIDSLIWIWCIVLAFNMLRTGGSVLLQVMRKFRILTLVNIPSAILAVLTAIFLIRQLGAPGAIWGTAIGEIVFCLLIWREIRNDRSNGN